MKFTKQIVVCLACMLALSAPVAADSFKYTTDPELVIGYSLADYDTSEKELDLGASSSLDDPSDVIGRFWFYAINNKTQKMLELFTVVDGSRGRFAEFIKENPDAYSRSAAISGVTRKLAFNFAGYRLVTVVLNGSKGQLPWIHAVKCDEGRCLLSDKAKGIAPDMALASLLATLAEREMATMVSEMPSSETHYTCQFEYPEDVSGNTQLKMNVLYLPVFEVPEISLSQLTNAVKKQRKVGVWQALAYELIELGEKSELPDGTMPTSVRLGGSLLWPLSKSGKKIDWGIFSGVSAAQRASKLDEIKPLAVFGVDKKKMLFFLGWGGGISPMVYWLPLSRTTGSWDFDFHALRDITLRILSNEIVLKQMTHCLKREYEIKLMKEKAADKVVETG